MQSLTKVSSVFAKAFTESLIKVAAARAAGTPNYSSKSGEQEKTSDKNEGRKDESWSKKKIRSEEAYRILNLDPKQENLTKQDVKERFRALFKANDVTSGGSFYLQSKIFRAKETLERILPEGMSKPDKEDEETQQKDK